MATLELIRNADVPLRFDLAGFGSLTFVSTSLRAAGGEAAGDPWELRKTGLAGRRKEARDASGELVGEFQAEQWHKGEFGKGARLTWRAQELRMRRSTKTGHTFELLDGDGRELLTLRARRWDAKKADMGTVWVDDFDGVEPGLILFATFAKFAEGKG